MKNSNQQSGNSQAGAKIPPKPRDCAPHVDDWPILDTQVGDAPKPKTDESGRPKGPAES